MIGLIYTCSLNDDFDGVSNLLFFKFLLYSDIYVKSSSTELYDGVPGRIKGPNHFIIYKLIFIQFSLLYFYIHIDF